jgi:glycosyltransferase involved in cell wall biosynthesis
MKKNSKDLVSIIMNCHNGEEFLEKSLKSIKEQTFKNWELIFWDNKSSDSSKKIFEKFKNKKMKYYRSKKFLNLHQARNEALKKILGKFICFLDVDDYWEKDKLLIQRNIFKNNENIDVCYGNVWIYNKNTILKKKIMTNKTLPSGYIFNDLINSYIVPLCSIMIKKKILTKNKIKFNEKYKIIGDFDLMARLSQKHEFFAVQKPIATYRVHGQNMFIKKRNTEIKELKSWLNNFQNKKKTINLSGLKKKILYLELLEKRRYLSFFKKIKKIYELKNYQNLFRLIVDTFFPEKFLRKFKFFS